MGITLQEIEDLSIEVKALVDAGLPLETHLASAGKGHGKRLQELTQTISESLSNGQSLEDTIRSSKSGASRMLAASVAAGIRSGQLGATVEVLGDMAHDIVDLRRRILQSISYPLTVMGLALVMFCVFIRAFLSRVRYALLDDIEASDSALLGNLLRWDATYYWWPILVPILGLVCLLVWLVSGRAASISFRGPERLMLLLPGVRGMVRDLQFYNLSRMLCLLVERNIPLDESLLLAGACCGSDSLDNACQTAAAEITKGNSPVTPSANWKKGSLPPLVATCLRQTSDHEDVLNHRLSGVAGYYRRRLQVSVAWLRNIVPIAMFVIIGGGSVVVYGLTVFWPVTEIYQLLSLQ